MFFCIDLHHSTYSVSAEFGTITIISKFNYFDFIGTKTAGKNILRTKSLENFIWTKSETVKFMRTGNIFNLYKNFSMHNRDCISKKI